MLGPSEFLKGLKDEKKTLGAGAQLISVGL